MRDTLTRPVLTPKVEGHGMDIIDYLDESLSVVECECGFTQEVHRGDASEIAVAVGKMHLAKAAEEAE